MFSSRWARFTSAVANGERTRQSPDRQNRGRGVGAVDHEQRLRQVPVAVAEIVLQVVALVLERVERLILDLPTRPPGAHQLDDVVGGGYQVGDPCLMPRR